jgi:hypothetical protein
MSCQGDTREMKERTAESDAKTKMTFDFYKQEREEFANLSRERTALSLQLLVILGALSYAFFQAGSTVVKWGISGVVVILGLIGFITNISLESEMRIHVARARAARGSIDFLLEFVEAKPKDQKTSTVIRQDKLYMALMIVIMLVGLSYIFTLILK